MNGRSRFNYESRSQQLASRAVFVERLMHHVFLALALVAVSLAVGIAGYCYFVDLPVIDAFLNSAMLLGGMGPVDKPQTSAGKLFAGIYALYAGLIVIASTALIAAPVAHRIMHRFHWDS